MAEEDGDWKPKRIVFDQKTAPKVDDRRPKAIVFPPKNNSVNSMSDSDQGPKAVNFGNKPKDQNNGPKPAAFPAPNPTKAQDQTGPRSVVFSSPSAQKTPPAAAPFERNFVPSTANFSAAPKTGDQIIEQRTGMKIRTPEEAKFERMLSVAQTIEPSIGNRPGFAKMLQTLCDMTPRDVINWGAKSLEVNAAVSDKLANITRDLTFLEVTRWIDEAKTEATKPPEKPGLFSAFKAKSQPPEFYEQKLRQIRKTMDEIISTKIDAILRDFDAIPDTFGMETLAIKVWSEGLTDAVGVQLADNRYRIMLTAQQGILLTKQTLENLQVTVTNSIQQIDELLLTVIPNWKIAFAHQK